MRILSIVAIMTLFVGCTSTKKTPRHGCCSSGAVAPVKTATTAK